MSYAEDIRSNFPEGTIKLIGTDKSSTLNGQSAITVRVILNTGKSVTGIFATEARPGFGGVEFKSKKDVVGLMTSKIESVLKGTAE